MTPLEQLELILHRMKKKHPFMDRLMLQWTDSLIEEIQKFNKEKEKDAQRESPK